MDNGELADFESFYRGSFPAVLTRLRRYCDGSADDVAQEAFAAAFASWSEVRRLRAPDAWVWVVARRAATRRLERDRRRRELEPSMPHPAGEDVEQRVIDHSLVHTGLATLSHRQRAAVELHHLLDRPIDDVCDLLGCTPSAAKVWLHRARRHLAGTASGLLGRWEGSVRWTTDRVISRAHALGETTHDEVLAELVPGRSERRVLTVRHDRYELATADGELLDHGTCTLNGDVLLLDPQPVPGTVRLGVSLDGERLDVRFLSNTTPLWFGVEDRVYSELLLGSETFSWTPL